MSTPATYDALTRTISVIGATESDIGEYNVKIYAHTDLDSFNADPSNNRGSFSFTLKIEHCVLPVTPDPLTWSFADQKFAYSSIPESFTPAIEQSGCTYALQ